MIKFLTRRDKLESNLRDRFTNITDNDIKYICDLFDDYEKNNLKMISTLKREKKVEMRKINGAIKQFLNVHPRLTKDLINSLGKRVYGAILSDKKKKTIVQHLKSIIGFTKK